MRFRPIWMPKDIGLGVATTFGQERDMPTWVACVARVRVDRATGRVVVEKLTVVVDAGTVVRMRSPAYINGIVVKGKHPLVICDDRPSALTARPSLPLSALRQARRRIPPPRAYRLA